MSIETIAVISSGDMGHVVGKVIREKGYRVITSLEDRSELTHERAKRSKMENVGSIEAVMREADVVLSIMPPESALEFAKLAANVAASASGKCIFVDCNAVSISTTEKIQDLVENPGIDFIKIGIVGPPPRRVETGTRFYAAGPAVEKLSFLDGDGISYRNLGDKCSSAAAMKMCYAALTKGTMTLQTSVLIAAELLGISDQLHNELGVSQAYHWELMKKRVPFLPADADRWAGEMDEISETFAGVGITDNFHRGAADVFRMLNKTDLSAETRETLDKSRTLKEAIVIYADKVNSDK